MLYDQFGNKILTQLEREVGELYKKIMENYANQLEKRAGRPFPWISLLVDQHGKPIVHGEGKSTITFRRYNPLPRKENEDEAN
jgi:hypothetical protein